jgi:hypothetical protein
VLRGNDFFYVDQLGSCDARRTRAIRCAINERAVPASTELVRSSLCSAVRRSSSAIIHERLGSPRSCQYYELHDWTAAAAIEEPGHGCRARCAAGAARVAPCRLLGTVFWEIVSRE